MRGTGDSRRRPHGRVHAAGAGRRARGPAWIREQPWCDGNLGMWGISWGGFNSLQIAALRPPGLGAIMTLCSTDDRYADDVHYRGGCVLGLDMLHWASSMLTWNARPPDPRLYGEGWREAWLDRLETLDPWIEHWLGPPAPRRVLEARLGLRGLRRDRVPGLRGRRLRRRLHERRAAAARRALRAAQGPHRALGARFPASGCPARRSASSRRPCAGSTTG